MDFTGELSDPLDSPGLVRAQSRRRAVVYHEEDSQDAIQDAITESSTESVDADWSQPGFAPPCAIGMTIRYLITWTQVVVERTAQNKTQSGNLGSSTYSLKTHRISLDILSHLTVFEVIQLAVREFAQLVSQDIRSQSCFQEGSLGDWEARFARKDGVARFDYPALDPSQTLKKVANLNQLALVQTKSLERTFLERADEMPTQPSRQLPANDQTKHLQGLSNLGRINSKQCGNIEQLSPTGSLEEKLFMQQVWTSPAGKTATDREECGANKHFASPKSPWTPEKFPSCGSPKVEITSGRPLQAKSVNQKLSVCTILGSMLCCIRYSLCSKSSTKKSPTKDTTLRAPLLSPRDSTH